MRKSSKQPRTFGRTKAKQRPQQKQQKRIIIYPGHAKFPHIIDLDVYIDPSVGMELYHRIKQRYDDLFRKLADM